MNNTLLQLQTARRLLIEMGGHEEKLKQVEKAILFCINNLLNAIDD